MLQDHPLIGGIKRHFMTVRHYNFSHQNGKLLSVSCILESPNVARKSPNPAMPSNKEFGLSGTFFKLLK